MKRKNFSVRLPVELLDELDRITESIGNGANRNGLIEWACEWYCQAYRAHGNRPLTKFDAEGLMNYLRNKANQIPQPVDAIDPAAGGAGTVQNTKTSRQITRRK